MVALGEYIHDQGCFFGVHSSDYLQTCGGHPASLFSEQRNASTYANERKIDYLKNNSCHVQAGMTSRARYFTMGRALKRTKRKCSYFVEGWQVDELGLGLM